MADRPIIIKRYTGSAWENVYPKTTIAQVINLSTELADLQTGINNRLLATGTAKNSEKLGGVLPGGYALASHSHAIANITGLQTALDSKVDDSQVLTNVPAGAKFTDTVYTHPASHAISFITGLQAALNAKIETVTGTMIENALGSLPATQAQLLNYVPTGRKINGKTLGADITLNAGDVGALASGGTAINSSKLNNQSASYYQAASNAWNKSNLTFSVSGSTLTITAT